MKCLGIAGKEDYKEEGIEMEIWWRRRWTSHSNHCSERYEWRITANRGWRGLLTGPYLIRRNIQKFALKRGDLPVAKL